MIMGKIKTNFIYYLMAVVVTTAFFIHETVIPESKNVSSLRSEWLSFRKESRSELKKIKEASKNTDIYQVYQQKKYKTDVAFEKLKKAKKEDKFLQFDNLKLFMGEFGWAFGLFLYSLFNLILSFIRKTKAYFGEITLHSILLYISFFYLRWTFLEKDYSNFQYLFTCLICTIGIIYSTYLLLRIKDKYLESLRNNKLSILVNWILDIRNEYFQKIAITALSNDLEKEKTLKTISEFESRNNEELSKIVE